MAQKEAVQCQPMGNNPEQLQDQLFEEGVLLREKDKLGLPFPFPFLPLLDFPLPWQ